MNAATIAALARFLAEARKAYTAAIAAAGAVLGPKLASGAPLSQTDYELALGAAIFAAVLVYFVPNQAPAAPSTPPAK